MGQNMGEDGYDVVELLAKKDWCNGNIGMAGNSFLAISQWHIAAQQPPSLKAIAPWEGCGDLFREQFVRGGVFEISNMDLINKLIIKGNNGIEDFFEMYEREPLHSPYWADKRADMTKIKIPAYISGSDFSSIHTMGSIRGFWECQGPKWIRWSGIQEWHDLYCVKESTEELLEFFDHYLKGKENDFVAKTPKVRWALLQGGDRDAIENVEIPDFPLPDTDYRDHFLAADGKLAESAPGQASTVSYVSRVPRAGRGWQHSLQDSDLCEEGVRRSLVANHRVDLHNELKRLATTEEGPGSPATIRTAAKVVRVGCEEGVVELQDGEVIKAYMIVAADGIHSVARTAVLGDQPIAKRPGHSAHRALIPADIVTSNPRIAHIVAGNAQGTGLTTYMGPDRRLVAYPCRRSQYLNIVAIVPDSEAEGSTEQWQVPGRPEQLLESFSAFCEDAKDILRNVSSCALWQLREQDPLETWTKGKVILIGDAAHAMLPHQGQGGGQAIEDAEALGVFLPSSTTPSSVPELLKRAEKVR